MFRAGGEEEATAGESAADYGFVEEEGGDGGGEAAVAAGEAGRVVIVSF